MVEFFGSIYERIKRNGILSLIPIYTVLSCGAINGLCLNLEVTGLKVYHNECDW